MTSSARTDSGGGLEEEGESLLARTESGVGLYEGGESLSASKESAGLEGESRSSARTEEGL